MIASNLEQALNQLDKETYVEKHPEKRVKQVNFSLIIGLSKLCGRIITYFKIRMAKLKTISTPLNDIQKRTNYYHNFSGKKHLKTPLTNSIRHIMNEKIYKNIYYILKILSYIIHTN
jgi:hypothetical protein